MRDYGSCEITEDVLARLPAGLREGEHALDESEPRAALAAKAALQPEHGAPERALGDGVGRLNTLYGGKRPERVPRAWTLASALALN